VVTALSQLLVRTGRDALRKILDVTMIVVYGSSMKPEPDLLLTELKQRRPFPNRAQEAVVAIRRTADVVYRTMARCMEPYGITDQQYNVLRILRGAHPDSLPTLEIGERMIERQPGVTRLLDRLEAKRLVRRQRSSEDRRVVDCWITESGLELLRTMDVPVDEADRRLMRHLTDDDLGQLVGLLEKVRRAEAAS
jgi:MarR family transcriptional regulator, organic hydroperoxide resistance regulator